MPVIEVRLLGPVDLLIDGRSVRPSAAKPRMVLALLALASPAPLRAEELADRLWAGAPPATAASVLRTYVSQLRRALPDEGRVERTGDGWVLHLAPHELDVRRFESLVDSATSGSPPPTEAAAVLREALGLWRGPPLVELADDAAAMTVAAGLEERRWLAIEALAEAELALGLHRSVIADLEPAVAESPLREQLVGRLMVALYRSGRQMDALAAYQRLRRALVDELGLEPSADLQRLEHAILEQDPSLAAPARRLGNIPVPVSSLVGRDEELSALASELERARLVTLTGPGGTGKTRLAIEAASTADGWPDGAWFVDLAARRQPAEVAAAVLEALGLAQHAGKTVAATAAAALRDRRGLLVLDNCEHVSSAAAELAAAVLASAPGMTILATSRAPLDVPGETLRAVAPLSVPAAGASAEEVASSPAGRLLLERVTAARSGHTPSPEEWDLLGELCRQVEGLPLAIELLAARAATLSIADLRRDVVLDRASARSPHTGHHESVASCVQWSLDLLDSDHRRLLELVSLLRGPFAAGPAGALVGEPDEGVVIARLSHLARHSLLSALPGSAMYRVLEPVRQVARRAVAPGEAAAALDRLAAWAAGWTESVEPALRGPDAARVLDRLEGQRGVLDAALDHALEAPDPTCGVRIVSSVSAMWSYRGHFAEGTRWIERALAAAERIHDRGLRMRLLVAAGSHSGALGDHGAFRRHLDDALALARAAGIDDGAVRVLLWAGHAAALHDDHVAAQALYTDALELAQAAHDASSAASALAGLGDVAGARGDLQAAAALHLRSLAEFRAAGDAHGIGQALLNVAENDRRSGRTCDAERVLREAATVFGSIHDRSCLAATDEGLARVAVDDDRLAEAESLYLAAIATRRELEQHPAAARSLVALARVLSELDRPGDAAAALGAAGDDSDPLARRLRDALGERAYLEAWAAGSADRGPVSR